MGYESYYTLGVEGNDKDIKDFITYCKSHNDDNLPRTGYTYGDLLKFYNQEADWTKWYDCKGDMEGVSKNWPSLKFTIHAKGEGGEEWLVKAWGGNTKEVGSHVVFDDFSWDEIAPLIGKLEIVLNENEN